MDTLPAHIPADFIDTFVRWPEPVAKRAYAIRDVFLDTAREMGIAQLDESLKWAAPAWRPRKGGATLRLSWQPGTEGIGIYVDCKTDLCARMMSDFPNAFRFVPPRVMYPDADADLPIDALQHLARMAFRYSRVIPR